MDCLQHDPRTKQNIKDMLYKVLYDPVQRQLKTQIDDIIMRNTIIGRHSHKSFIYKGTVYSCDNTPAPVRKNRLDPSLREAMETYLAEIKRLNEEEVPYVLGFINQVLNSSEGMQDYLKLFPDALHPPLLNLAATCPCKTSMLPEEKVALLKEKNQSAITLMRERMVLNLLI